MSCVMNFIGSAMRVLAASLTALSMTESYLVNLRRISSEGAASSAHTDADRQAVSRTIIVFTLSIRASISFLCEAVRADRVMNLVGSVFDGLLRVADRADLVTHVLVELLHRCLATAINVNRLLVHANLKHAQHLQLGQ